MVSPPLTTAYMQLMDHPLLLSKLHSIAFCDSALSWFLVLLLPAHFQCHIQLLLSSSSPFC
ncbi:unnamed protein product, partial [Staurois parvus]